MKRFFAIAVLVSVLCSTTELHEFFKLPHLLVHFVEHYNKSTTISLGEYLHIHYAHDHQNHQDEHHDHGCLPFQDSHGCQLLGFSANPAHHGDFHFTNPTPTIGKRTLFDESAHSSYHANIWQPPKIG